MVVEKLRATIPESSLIFIAFQNKFLATSEAVAFAKILRYSTHRKIRLLARRLENPRQHGRGGCFAVRAADHNGMPPGQKYFFKNFRHGAIRDLTIEYLFQLRIASRNDIPDNYQVGSRRQIRSVKRMKERDAQAFEQRGSRRVHT